MSMDDGAHASAVIQSPLLEVGALLDYNSALDPPDRFLGGKDWVLAGSCVLVARKAALTVAHTVGRWHRRAVFLPGQGFFETWGRPEPEEGQRSGDNVVILRLKDRVPMGRPVRAAWVGRKYVESIGVLGYGRWETPAGSILDGIQRVRMVMARRNLAYHNLDLIWNSSENGGLKVGELNSGGPMLLLTKNGQLLLVGLNRQSDDDRQIGSRIAHDRWEWLERELVGGGRSSGEPLQVDWKTAVLSADEQYGTRFNLPVPTTARRLQLTVTAGPEAFIKARTWLERAPDDFRQQVLQDTAPGGRFLYRELELLEGTTQVAVGAVSKVDEAGEAREVEIQVCALFT